MGAEIGRVSIEIEALTEERRNRIVLDWYVWWALIGRNYLSKQVDAASTVKSTIQVLLPRSHSRLRQQTGMSSQMMLQNHVLEQNETSLRGGALSYLKDHGWNRPDWLRQFC